MTGERDAIAASVRVRLLNLAHARSEDFQLVLVRYVNERLLYRLSRSRHRDRFVLKGATLFAVWQGAPHRATRDVDLLGFGDLGGSALREMFAEISTVNVEDDGLRFDPESIRIEPIRDRQEYGGTRLQMTVHLATARIRVQVDVGVGDAIRPEPMEVELPTLLDQEPPRLRAYPREAVVAEKLEAMVTLGMANSRMKDFYDLAELAARFEFDGEVLAGAIRATFDRRGTAIPHETPVALTAEFGEDAGKVTQWEAFRRKSGIDADQGLLGSLVRIQEFVMQPLRIAGSGESWTARWSAGGPWRE